MARRVVLISPLAPVALATRLKAVVPATVTRETPAGVIGRGTEAELTMWYYRPNFRNDLQTTFTATIEPAGSGSRIAGRLGAPVAGLVFMGCWLGFVALFLLVGVGILFLPGAPWQIAAAFLGIPGAMLGFGALFVWLALRNGRRDAAAILDFLAQAVDAR